jgi:hypothetical protein
MPAASSAIVISTSSAPSLWPASARAPIGAASVVSPSCANDQAMTGAAATSTPSSASAPRRRSGTRISQKAMPTAAASSAPREYESIMQTTSRPRPGQASALAAACPERRAASHSSGRTPRAAISPTAFQ